jgi:molybdopterin-binding protein/molybdate transport repressor ModE-like protein
MTTRETVIAPVDIDLLGLLRRTATLTEACRTLGISRDRGVYRLRRLSRALGAPVVRTVRGGAPHGTTRLTPAGLALLRRGAGRLAARGPSARSTTVVLAGYYAPGTPPIVQVPGGPPLAVAFDARPDERVRIVLEAESVLLARQRIATSARNVLEGIVERVHASGPGTGGAQRLVMVRVGTLRLPAAVTTASVQSLRLAPGRRVFLYVKATALHRR